MSELAKQAIPTITDKALECISAIPNESQQEELFEIAGTIDEDNGPVSCPLAKYVGASAFANCMECDFRPGQDFLRTSYELNAENIKFITQEYRKTVRDSLTTSSIDREKPAPVANEFYRMTLTDVKKEELRRVAGTLPLVCRYGQDIKELRQHDVLYQDDITRLQTERNLVVSLLTVPPIMQRNHNSDKIYDGNGRETAEMTELMGRLFDYTISHDGTTSNDLAMILRGFVGDAPDAVKDQIRPILQGVAGEVAVYKVIKGAYRHGTEEEDMIGRDFVDVDNPNRYIDVKCWRLNRDQGKLPNGSYPPIEDVAYNPKRHRLYVPPRCMDLISMTVAPKAELAIRKILRIKY